MVGFGGHYMWIFSTEKIIYYTHKPLNYLITIWKNMFYNRHPFFKKKMERIEDLKNVFSQHS